MHQMIDDYFKKNDIKPKIIGNSSEAEICFQIAKYNLAYSLVTASTYENYADKEYVVAVNILPSITRKLYMISSKESGGISQIQCSIDAWECPEIKGFLRV